MQLQLTGHATHLMNGCTNHITMRHVPDGSAVLECLTLQTGVRDERSVSAAAGCGCAKAGPMRENLPARLAWPRHDDGDDEKGTC